MEPDINLGFIAVILFKLSLPDANKSLILSTYYESLLLKTKYTQNVGINTLGWPTRIVAASIPQHCAE